MMITKWHFISRNQGRTLSFHFLSLLNTSSPFQVVAYLCVLFIYICILISFCLFANLRDYIFGLGNSGHYSEASHDFKNGAGTGRAHTERADTGTDRAYSGRTDTTRVHIERAVAVSTEHVKKLREKYFDSKETLKPMRILVIDDSSTCRHTIHRTLSESGHTIIEADCGFVGAEMVQRGLTAESYGLTGSGFDLLLISHTLKATSGRQTAFKMRSIGFVGIILGLMGAPPHPQELTHYMELGANNVLVKPFSAFGFNQMILGKIF